MQKISWNIFKLFHLRPKHFLKHFVNLCRSHMNLLNYLTCLKFCFRLAILVVIFGMWIARPNGKELRN